MKVLPWSRKGRYSRRSWLVAAGAAGVALSVVLIATPAAASEWVSGGSKTCRQTEWVTTTTYAYGNLLHEVLVGGAWQLYATYLGTPTWDTKVWNYHYVDGWFINADLLDESQTYATCY